VTTSQEAVNIVKKGLSNGKSSHDVSTDLVNYALQTGSRDNVTVMVVILQ
jgi:serine/threonine protein phosphatase PrpC